MWTAWHRHKNDVVFFMIWSTFYEWQAGSEGEKIRRSDFDMMIPLICTPIE